ncbi:MAG TPA: Rne/Rng family ribonuclease [Candidatus Omnitrophota bacterium]|nr:Rne/Rng family ribonuclease [Candidatus Omnitrophota bacterium]
MMRKKKDNVTQEGITILVNSSPIETRVAILEKGKLIDFIMERESLESYAGSIYKGKVDSIVPGIEAAFVNIGMEKNGFMHVSDVLDKGSLLREYLDDEEEPAYRAPKKGPAPRIDNLLRVGQEIMVQVVKEAIGTKGPRLTSYISIPGRYIVLTPHDPNIGISRRIREKEERDRIRNIINSMKFPEGTGCIVRTMAEHKTDQELLEEIKYLLNLWERIKERNDKNPAPVTVYEEYGVVLRMIRDKFTENVSTLIVDSNEEYDKIIKFLKSFRPELREKVKYYNAKIPLFQKYDIEKQIDAIFNRTVPLKSGGYLIIEQTEGVVVIDVNSGRFTGKTNLEDTAHRTNVEAAREIPRQLVLRDVGGIVIIDFIDMEQKKHRDDVYNILQQELKKDKARISVENISQFGIVEMTRQRMRKSLESTSHTLCPYCNGKGMIKSVETIGIETVRRIERIFANAGTKHKHVTVVAHPDVVIALLSDQAKMLSDIQRKHRCRIDLKEDHTLHREEVIVSEGRH